VADPPEFVSPDPLPSETVNRREEDARLTQALSELSPALRSAFTLVVLQGMDTREAARLEGCLAASMYRRVHVARKTLQEKLKDLL
jgi:RNA polymerase sigma factor (sigma-70 family)